MHGLQDALSSIYLRPCLHSCMESSLLLDGSHCDTNFVPLVPFPFSPLSPVYLIQLKLSCLYSSFILHVEMNICCAQLCLWTLALLRPQIVEGLQRLTTMTTTMMIMTAR